MILQRVGDSLPENPPHGLGAALVLLGELLEGIDSPHAFMPRERHIGLCRACGERRQLTFEHVPPASSGNATRARGTSSIEVLTADDPLRFPGRGWFPSQRGIGGYVLCEACNNLFGLRYVPSYGAFAQIMLARLEQQHRMAGHLPGIIDLQLGGWELGAIGRAALVALMGVGVHDRLLTRYPQLPVIVAGGVEPLPKTLRLGLRLVVGARGRLTAPLCRADTTGCVVFSEVALTPFAWTLSMIEDGLLPLPETVDVSHWLSYPHDAPVADETVALPLGFVDSPTPGDYRPGEAIRADRPDVSSCEE